MVLIGNVMHNCISSKTAQLPQSQVRETSLATSAIQNQVQNSQNSSFRYGSMSNSMKVKKSQRGVKVAIDDED